MFRGLLSLLIAAAPIVVLLPAAGCEQEVKTVKREERVEESEPQMVSPGEPIVE